MMTAARRESSPPGGRQIRRDTGFSLIEVLVAAVILLVIALGLVPLYSRSIRSNVEGFDYTRVSNSAKSRAEEFLQYDFNGERLTLPAGAAEREIEDFYSQQEHKWMEDLPDGDTALFTRTTTIRQFSATDIENPLHGDAPLDAVHLKEITVAVRGSLGGSAFGPGKRIVVRVFKAH